MMNYEEDDNIRHHTNYEWFEDSMERTVTDGRELRSTKLGYLFGEKRRLERKRIQTNSPLRDLVADQANELYEGSEVYDSDLDYSEMKSKPQNTWK